MIKTLKSVLKLKKTHNKILIVSAFFLFLSFSSVFSAIIITQIIDDFESYSNGYDLQDSPLWQQIITTLKIGTNSYEGNFAINSDGTSRSSGLMEEFTDSYQNYSYYHYHTANAIGNTGWFYFRGQAFARGVQVQVGWNGTDWAFVIDDSPSGLVSSLVVDGTGWYKIDVEIDLVLDKIRMKATNITKSEIGLWTNWVNFYDNANFTGIHLMPWTPPVYGFGFDKITTSGEDTIFNWGYDIGLEITTPEIGSIIEIPTNNATTTGNWEVRSNSTLYWGRIYAVLKDLATGNNLLFYDTITGTAGSSGAFSIDLENIPDGNYSLCWASTGDQIPYITKWVYFYCEEEYRTILRVGNYPELPRYILLENYVPCDYEDCDQLNILETLVCKIKNFLTSLYCPSPEKLLDLKLTIDEMKNKFPISYLRLAREEYNFLRNEVTQKETIDLTIFGNKAEVNVNFFENIKDGNDRSLMSYLKIFINGLLGLSFIMYAIYFIKRIF